MSLGLTTSSGEGGEFNQICKYDARAGRFFRVDRELIAGAWETNNVEITQGFQAVFDFEQIEVGYILFSAGAAPQWCMVKLGEPLPAKPSDKHRQGFRIMLKLGKNIGGDVREFASCAGVVINAMDALHDQYKKEAVGAARGKLPVVSMTGSTPVVSNGKGQSSTNYAPVFKITKWIARPEDLPVGAEPKRSEPGETEPDDDGFDDPIPF